MTQCVCVIEGTYRAAASEAGFVGLGVRDADGLVQQQLAVELLDDAGDVHRVGHLHKGEAARHGDVLHLREGTGQHTRLRCGRREAEAKLACSPCWWKRLWRS